MIINSSYYFNNILLQDSIETYLIHEISARYESFFEASVFVHELKGNVNTLLTQVTEKRKVMDTLVEETKEHAENAVQLKRKRANMTAALKLATVCIDRWFDKTQLSYWLLNLDNNNSKTYYLFIAGGTASHPSKIRASKQSSHSTRSRSGLHGHPQHPR